MPRNNAIVIVCTARTGVLVVVVRASLAAAADVRLARRWREHLVAGSAGLAGLQSPCESTQARCQQTRLSHTPRGTQALCAAAQGEAERCPDKFSFKSSVKSMHEGGTAGGVTGRRPIPVVVVCACRTTSRRWRRELRFRRRRAFRLLGRAWTFSLLRLDRALRLGHRRAFRLLRRARLLGATL